MCIRDRLVDYPKSKAEEFANHYCINCIGLGTPSKLVRNKYNLVASIVIHISRQKPDTVIRTCWWGVAFGMAFTYKIIKNFADNVITTYGTVKHCYEFSPIIVDKLITCTPWLVPDNPMLSNSLPFFSGGYYNIAELKESNLSQKISYKIHSQIIELIKILKNRGYTIASSLSRPGKLSTEFEVELKNLLIHNPKLIYLRLSGDKINLDLSLSFNNPRLNKNDYRRRLIDIPWLHPKSVPTICRNLDLFLDPFPFGAGMTACMAFANGIPVLSCQKSFKTPSTMTSVHYYISHSIKNTSSNYMLNKQCTYVFYNFICTKDSSLNNRYEALMTSTPQAKESIISAQKEILHKVFIKTNKNLIENLIKNI